MWRTTVLVPKLCRNAPRLSSASFVREQCRAVVVTIARSGASRQGVPKQSLGTRCKNRRSRSRANSLQDRLVYDIAHKPDAQARQHVS